MTVTATYLDDLARVRLEVSALDLAATEATVERSTDGVRWAPVRGGAPAAVTAAGFVLDDYEFADRVLNTYRVTPDVGPAEQTTITPALADMWIKSLTRPFLNLPVALHDAGTVERSARHGVFDIVGRSVPVAVTDVRGSRRRAVSVLTSTQTEADALDVVLASGDAVYVHVPTTMPLPSMYAVIGDTSAALTARAGTRHRFDLPLIEVAAPDVSIVGSTVTWAGIVNAFATWADVLAAEATWSDLADRIGDPSDVIVG